MKIVLGTRGSKLAIAQTNQLFQFLKVLNYEVEIKCFNTYGDKWLLTPISKQFGNGIFTKELELALLSNEVDILVHSFKDVPITRPNGIITACIPKRENPYDLLIMRQDAPENPTIGTSSERRCRLLSYVMPNANFTWIRGNIDTRIDQLRSGHLRGSPLHGIVLAVAGLNRLNIDISDMVTKIFKPNELIPAPGQGAILLEINNNKKYIIDILSPMHDLKTERLVTIERRVLAKLGGGCQEPLGVLAVYESNDDIHLRSSYFKDNKMIWSESKGKSDDILVKNVVDKLII